MERTNSTFEEVCDCYTSKKFKEAEKILQDVIFEKGEVLGSSHAQILRARNNLVSSLIGQAKFQEVENQAAELISLAEMVLGSYNPESLKAKNNYIAILGGLKKLEDGEKLG